MKNIVVIYKGDDWKKKIPIGAGPTRKSFENWHERGLNYGIAMYRASIKWYDIDKNVFKKAWMYRNKEWIKVNKAVKPDMMFDKIMSKRDYELFNWKMQVSKKVRIYNDPLFRTIIDNKLSQYLAFSEFMAKSYFVSGREKLLDNLKNIKGKKVVLKPLYGSGGFGIVICNKNEVQKKRFKYPLFVQEFIETKGIPNVSKIGDIADLRLVFINHKLIYALTRIAKKGSLFTNFHQGAEAIMVPKKDIPKQALIMTGEIQKKLRLFPEANYSLDYMFDKKGKPYLVEMNTTPGFDLLEIVGDERIKREYFEEFIRIIK